MAIGAPSLGTAVQATTAGTTRNVPYPAVVGSGDVAVMVEVNGSGSASAIDTPTGGPWSQTDWNVVAQVTNTGNTLPPAAAMWWRVCNGTEGGTTVTVTSTSVTASFAIMTFSGVDNSSPLDGGSGVGFVIDDKTSADRTISFPTITPVTANCTIVYVVAANSTTVTCSPLSGFTEAYDRTVTSARGWEVAYQQGVTAAAHTYSTTLRWSGSTKDTGVMIALRPVSLTTVTATRSTTWDTQASVASTRATTWDVLSAVTSTRATTWDVTVTIAASRATTWNVAAPVVTVAATRATTWRTLARTTPTRATTWDALSAVAASRATTWRVRGSVTTSRATTWDALTSTITSRATTWRVGSAVAATRATTWRVLKAVTPTRSTTWNVAGSVLTVVASRVTTWRVLAKIAPTRSTTWRTLAKAVPTRATTWRTLSAVARSRATTWDVLTSVGKAASTTWGVLTSAAATRTTTWRTLAQTDSEATATWNTLETVDLTASTTWDVRGRIVTSVSTTWRTLVEITRTRLTTWKVAAPPILVTNPRASIRHNGHAATLTVNTHTGEAVDSVGLNDLLPAWECVLSDGSSTYDATGADTVTVNCWRDGILLFSRPATSVEADGVVTMAWQPGDTDDPGPLKFKVVVERTGSLPATFPPKGHMITKVHPFAP